MPVAMLVPNSTGVSLREQQSFQKLDCRKQKSLGSENISSFGSMSLVINAESGSYHNNKLVLLVHSATSQHRQDTNN